MQTFKRGKHNSHKNGFRISCEGKKKRSSKLVCYSTHAEPTHLNAFNSPEGRPRAAGRRPRRQWRAGSLPPRAGRSRAGAAWRQDWRRRRSVAAAGCAGRPALRAGTAAGPGRRMWSVRGEVLDTGTQRPVERRRPGNSCGVTDGTRQTPDRDRSKSYPDPPRNCTELRPGEPQHFIMT